MSAFAELKAVLGLDSTKFQAGVKSADAGVSAFQGSLMKMGGVLAAAFSVQAIISFGKALIVSADALKTAADNVGITTAEMVGLQDIALKNNMSIDDMAKLLAKAQTLQLEVATNTGKAGESFERLGISINDVLTADPVTLLNMIAKAAFESGIPTAELANIFGEKLGARAVSGLKDLVANGLNPVDSSITSSIDKAAAWADAWEVGIQRVKNKMMGWAWDIFPTNNIYGDLLSQGQTEASQQDKRKAAAEELKRIRAKTDADAISKKRAKDEHKELSDMDAKAQADMDRLKKDSTLKRARLEKDENNKRKLEKLDRRKLDEDEKAKIDQAEKIAGLQKMGKISGVGVSADAYAKMGGMIGGARPGLGVADRQIKIALEIKEINRLTNQKLDEIKQKFDQLKKEESESFT